MQSRKERLEKLIQQAILPIYLEIRDESDKHQGRKGQESHFWIQVVSPQFEGLASVHRHRQVMGLLSEEFQRGLHAVTLSLLSPSEWRASPKEPFIVVSPRCEGKK